MQKTITNITPKYRQKTYYNYVGNGVFYGFKLLFFFVLRFCAIANLTAQIPTETLSQTHRVCLRQRQTFPTSKNHLQNNFWKLP